MAPPSLPPPPFQELKAYRAAMWGGFAFGVLGALLAAVFLRSVGVVGHIDPPKNEDRGDEKMYDARKASDEVPCTPKFKGLG